MNFHRTIVVLMFFAFQHFIFSSAAMYDVRVTTGNSSYAGTDSRVFIIMGGTQCRTTTHELKGLGDPFEKGQTDYFTVGDNVQIGDITKILLRTYWIEVFPAWELVSADVRPVNTKRWFHFPYNGCLMTKRWINIYVRCEVGAAKNPDTGVCEPVSSDSS